MGGVTAPSGARDGWTSESKDLRFAAGMAVWFSLYVPAYVLPEELEYMERELAADNSFSSCCMCLPGEPVDPPVVPNPELQPDRIAELLDGLGPVMRDADAVRVEAEAIPARAGVRLVVRVEGPALDVVDVALGAGGEWREIEGDTVWDDRAARSDGSAAWVFTLPRAATRSFVAVTTERDGNTRRTGTFVIWRPSLELASASARRAIALSSARWRAPPRSRSTSRASKSR